MFCVPLSSLRDKRSAEGGKEEDNELNAGRRRENEEEVVLVFADKGNGITHACAVCTVVKGSTVTIKTRKAEVIAVRMIGTVGCTTSTHCSDA